MYNLIISRGLKEIAVPESALREETEKKLYEGGCQEKILPLIRRSDLFPLTASPAILVEPRVVAGRALCQFDQCESLGLRIPHSLAGCRLFGNHGSICDSRPIAISGHPRGTIAGAWP